MITTVYGHPLKGKRLEETQAFLGRLNLKWEEGIETTIVLEEDGRVIGTGSREKNVLKCIGVSCKHAGEGLSATILTELVKDAHQYGYSHLFLYTKPENIVLFQEFGFSVIAQTSDVALLENKRNGIIEFVASLQAENSTRHIGAIVANCNPFTNGHLYLIEKAATQVELLYVFILSENKSQFSTGTRTELARQGTAHLNNVVICPTGDYLISSATFPQYFLKEQLSADDVHCQLDLQIFGHYFAKELGITTRFVGTEPYCQVTKAYNEAMKQILPEYGVEIVEIPRKELGEEPISASLVRKLLVDKQWGELQPLVPKTTYDYLVEQYGN